jgi:hypothetical protein
VNGLWLALWSAILVGGTYAWVTVGRDAYVEHLLDELDAAADAITELNTWIDEHERETR